MDKEIPVDVQRYIELYLTQPTHSNQWYADQLGLKDRMTISRWHRDYSDEIERQSSTIYTKTIKNLQSRAQSATDVLALQMAMTGDTDVHRLAQGAAKTILEYSVAKRTDTHVTQDTPTTIVIQEAK